MLSQVEQCLVNVWFLQEKEGESICSEQLLSQYGIDKNSFQLLNETGMLKTRNGTISFTQDGIKRARKLVRQVRMVERFFTDILEIDLYSLESITSDKIGKLSEKSTTALCTLLGHPEESPSGMPIPVGACCGKASTQVESLITTADKLNIDEEATIIYVLAKHKERVHKLISLGAAYGVRFKLLQKKPACLVTFDETQLALEEDALRDIYVRRD